MKLAALLLCLPVQAGAETWALQQVLCLRDGPRVECRTQTVEHIAHPERCTAMIEPRKKLVERQAKQKRVEVLLVEIICRRHPET